MISSEDLEAMGYYDMVDEHKSADLQKKAFEKWWRATREYFISEPEAVYSVEGLCEYAFYSGWLERDELK